MHHVHAGTRGEEAVRFPEPGVRDGYEPLGVAAG